MRHRRLAVWLFGWFWSGIYGPWGVIVLLAVHTAPIAYLSGLMALRRISQPTRHAARIHGAGLWSAFYVVTWPSIKPSLLAAAGLVFAYNLGDFGIPFELGVPVHFQTTTTQIYADLTMQMSGGLPSAVLLSLLLSIIALALTMASLQKQNHRQTLMTLNASPSLRQRTGKMPFIKRLVLLVFALYTIVCVVIPLISTILVSLTRAYGLTPAPWNWDIHGLVGVFEGDVGSAARNSVMLAAATTGIVCILGLVTSEVAHRSRAGRWINRIAWVPYALPGSVIGVALILSDSRVLYGTLFIILLAYVARFWGLADTIVQLREQVPSVQQRAVRVSGGSPAAMYRLGIWPYLASSVQSTFIMVFVSAVYELTISSLLYGPSSSTLAVVVMSANQAGDIKTTAAISVWMTCLMVVAMALLTWLPTRVKRRIPRTPDTIPSPSVHPFVESTLSD
ncbi:ABC transporter permease subunit [Alicyclobacillus acidoterrestris]|uniref:ABC transporter permease subunit n=1 Tax=Alicyclobacillus acidoterrestris (strain ATCC 49025 / DSM 3922 / CIP 106132 / NCIMB 13137 / GD3B) TaxID=1356854 RepID=A0A9E6ZN63_ALIAG|nr:ABC transporter permease subunit [Alicyclobacillus acidoterrestris]UNO50851.1 ABC transporter permease subunit [Alicyclobacillus acidoterrestris]